MSESDWDIYCNLSATRLPAKQIPFVTVSHYKTIANMKRWGWKCFDFHHSDSHSFALEALLSELGVNLSPQALPLSLDLLMGLCRSPPPT